MQTPFEDAEMEELRKQLKETLATVFSFYLKAHNFHWNVEGPMFYEYHKMFGKIYQDVYSSIDGIAENLRKIGTYAPGSYTRFSELSKIEDCIDVPPVQDMVDRLLADNTLVIESLNASFSLAETINSQGLMNFLADRIDQHQKWAWFLRASKKNKGE